MMYSGRVKELLVGRVAGVTGTGKNEASRIWRTPGSRSSHRQGAGRLRHIYCRCATNV